MWRSAMCRSPIACGQDHERLAIPLRVRQPLRLLARRGGRLAEVRVRVVRKQYHFRPSPKGLHAWDVDRLIALAHNLPVQVVPLDQVVELETNYWFDHGYEPIVRAVVDHMRLIDEADLSYAIILDPDGRVMDGMHRVAKALLLGQATITAKRLWALPEPDYTDVQLDELPYDV